MKIVRIWLYKVVDQSLQTADAKPSDSNHVITKKVRGDFVYYKVDGVEAFESTRREAKTWSQNTGQAIETWLGYPAWMYDLGYRA